MNKSQNDKPHINFEDEIIQGCVVTHNGEIVNEKLVKT
mgnify:CR=1 FL=1